MNDAETLILDVVAYYLTYWGSDSIHSGVWTDKITSADFSVPRQRFHAALGSSLIT